MTDFETGSWGSPEDRLTKANAWLSAAKNSVADNPDMEGHYKYLEVAELFVSRFPEFADEFARMAEARSRAVIKTGTDLLSLQVAVMPAFIEGFLYEIDQHGSTQEKS